MNADGTLSSTYLSSVMYYDNRGRVIQTKSNNPLADGIEQEYLAYDFVGNVTQRKHVHQAAGTNSTIAGSIDFKDGTNTGDDYTYDANGNLTKDLNKNIVDIQYNVLNLPSKVTFGDGNPVSYMYAA